MPELEIKVRTALRDIRARAATATVLAGSSAADASLYRAVSMAYKIAADELEKALNDGT
jgi:hypothetical protein